MKGHAPLLDWIRDHVNTQHSPPAGQDTILTGGSNYTIEVRHLSFFASKLQWHSCLWLFLSHRLCFISLCEMIRYNILTPSRLGRLWNFHRDRVHGSGGSFAYANTQYAWRTNFQKSCLSPLNCSPKTIARASLTLPKRMNVASVMQ